MRKILIEGTHIELVGDALDDDHYYRLTLENGELILYERGVDKFDNIHFLIIEKFNDTNNMTERIRCCLFKYLESRNAKEHKDTG